MLEGLDLAHREAFDFVHPAAAIAAAERPDGMVGARGILVNNAGWKRGANPAVADIMEDA